MKYKATMKYSTIKATLVAVSILCANELSAAVVQYNASWSGAPNGNTATATAVISIDTALVPNPGSHIISSSIPLWFIDVQLTIQGATSGNGTFQKSDFQGLYWDTEGATLNLNQELVGQPTSNQPWGTPAISTSGDFNLFRAAGSPNAPTGTLYFQLTPSGSSNTMNLTSFAPVPEPSSAMLVAFATFSLAISRRR
jgi:hypothetical protein